MTYENLIYEAKDGIARITLNRPAAMNTFTFGVLVELQSALRRAEEDEAVRVVVLTGAGRAFSAGVDLNALKDPSTDRKKFSEVAREALGTIQSMGKAVIAMVNGYCLTGAMELAMACDLIIASEDAKFGDTHARWGLVTRWGGSQRLPRAVGLLKAKELAFTAELITGKEAEHIGLVNRAVPADKLEEATRELAEKIMANSPGSIAAYKHLFNRGAMRTLEEGLELESQFVVKGVEERLDSFGKKA